MSNEKLREEFEAWFSVNVPDINNLAAARAVKHMMIKELAFLTWQASRECLVIELPQIVGHEAGYDSIRENEYASQSSELFDADEVFALCRSIEVREAIEAAGVKVKS